MRCSKQTLYRLVHGSDAGQDRPAEPGHSFRL